MSETYSRDELERIFARATELEADPIASLPSRDTYSLAELRAIALDAGIDPDLVERAAREVASPESRANGILSREVELSLPTTLSEARALRALSAVRSSVRQQGTGETSPSGFSWTSDDKTVLITAHDEGGHTRLKVSSRASLALVSSSLFGVVAGWITAGMLEPITMGVFFGSISVGIGVTAALTSAAVGKARRQARSVLAAASRTIMDSDRATGRALIGDTEGSPE
jgi:hypothetical protein